MPVRLGPAKIVMPCHNQPHGRRPSPTLARIRRCLLHRRHLVVAVPFSILPESFLRSVVAEFLPLSRRLPRHYSVRSFSIPPWTQDRHPRGRALSDTVSSKCRSPNHPSRRAFLCRPRRLRDLRPRVRHLHRSPRAHIFPGRTLRNPTMAVSNRNTSWIHRPIRRHLVSSQRRRSTCSGARPCYLLRRDLLLGIVRRSR